MGSHLVSSHPQRAELERRGRVSGQILVISRSPGSVLNAKGRSWSPTSTSSSLRQICSRCRKSFQRLGPVASRIALSWRAVNPYLTWETLGLGGGTEAKHHVAADLSDLILRSFPNLGSYKKFWKLQPRERRPSFSSSKSHPEGAHHPNPAFKEDKKSPKRRQHPR